LALFFIVYWFILCSTLNIKSSCSIYYSSCLSKLYISRSLLILSRVPFVGSFGGFSELLSDVVAGVVVFCFFRATFRVSERVSFRDFGVVTGVVALLACVSVDPIQSYISASSVFI